MKILLAGQGAFGVKHLDGLKNIPDVEVVSLVGGSPQDYNRFWANVRAGIVNWNRPTNGAASNAPFGGIGLSGGKGGMRNVVVGALLIGIMLNAMIILDIPNIYQNLIKSTILLVAIIIDSFINPRDEQTAQQGDI